jgi:hypothetical protein
MRGSVGATPGYTCEPGRCIHRDGVPFAIIHRAQEPKTGAGPMPSDVDDFAHLCASAPALAAENERLQSAVNAGQDYIASLEATKREQTAALIEADAENERLREALERCADLLSRGTASGDRDGIAAVKAARAAHFAPGTTLDGKEAAGMFCPVCGLAMPVDGPCATGCEEDKP